MTPGMSEMEGSTEGVSELSCGRVLRHWKTVKLSTIRMKLLHTLTAAIYSARSDSNSELHSRRTEGSTQAFWALEAEKRTNKMLKVNGANGAMGSWRIGRPPDGAFISRRRNDFTLNFKVLKDDQRGAVGFSVMRHSRAFNIVCPRWTLCFRRDRCTRLGDQNQVIQKSTWNGRAIL